MSDAPEPVRAANVRRFLLGVSSGDSDGVKSLLSPEVVYSAPGQSALAGVFRGPGEVFDHIDKLFRITKGTFEVIKWVDWLVGRTHVAAILYGQAQGGGVLYKSHQVFVVETDGNDLLIGIRLFFEDQGAFDRFVAGIQLE
jgi:hypothetical protein